ncbi:MAG: AAA family ATPase [Gammaproteobacteria bacterium]|nr:AAA family ATPase [Gammaproteobacteria bacterium]
MEFYRQPAGNWQRDVPGARWFKADLQIHTLDDHPGGRVKLPDELLGQPDDPAVLARYARLFLKGLVAKGVQAAGLTPHSVRAGSTAETSAVWRIVEEWNNGEDDDGVPFREKIYALFPGFEPNVNDGSTGVHLLFLFDPEIGRDRFLALYDAVMEGRAPWQGRSLQPTTRSADEIFELLQNRQSESQGSNTPWHFIALAPHIESRHGVFQEMRSGALERLPCKLLAGYELPDEKLGSDYNANNGLGKSLLPFMQAHRQAFFHASDAYSMDDLGRRHTWVKLASPRIEALRQAFIASDSRMRIGFERNANNELRPLEQSPDVALNDRPWLKKVQVRGPAAFFDGAELHFSPDLNCIIGGSMTGKSTLLDGLRIHVQAPPPSEARLSEQVEARGREIFGAGSPQVSLDCPASSPGASASESWPAQFFAQSELQGLSQDASAIETILAKLIPAESHGIAERQEKLRILDGQLKQLAVPLSELSERLADAEQAHNRAKAAKQALADFSQAGVDDLHEANRNQQQWVRAQSTAQAIGTDVNRVSQSITGFDIPEFESAMDGIGECGSSDTGNLDPKGRWSRVVELIQETKQEMAQWIEDAALILASLDKDQERLQISVERALAARGLDAAKLREFQDLNRQAALLPSYKANLSETQQRLADSEQHFKSLGDERRNAIKDQRKAFDRVKEAIQLKFKGRFRVRRVENGDNRLLDAFLRSLKQKGITRWWNELDDDLRPSPDVLSTLLANEPDSEADRTNAPEGSAKPAHSASLAELGMSDAVQRTFHESLTQARKWELEALRCPDRYFLELRLDDGSYRPLDELSGGQRVSVLLSLLLETEDDRPLVIDQPEDELDNRFLFNTVLPVLKKLKGKRQVIVATHNANVVVNGDADLVIQLEATSKHGKVASCGAIEDASVRKAILHTVDGGEEAFRLRRQKYGF